MVLKSTPGANVSVYQISGANVSRSLPDWLVRKRKQSLKKDAEFTSRIELIQDFEFAEASNKVQVTRDGQFAMATGTYKPQIHVYDFNQLSLKFDRHTDAENVDFVLVSDDWKKSIHLQNDRTIEFHAQGGIHARTRIPTFGRDLSYYRRNCDLFVAASGSELYRLNVDQGRFLAPLSTSFTGVNTVDVSTAHGLLAAGGNDSLVEMWDCRTRQRVGTLIVDSHEGHSPEVTSLKFHQDGLHIAAGSSDGYTRLYDLRSPTPLIVKDQGYGFPIKKVGFLETLAIDNMVYSADKKIIKIWNKENGNPYTSLEPSVDINDVAHVPESGLFLVANEGIPMHTYYVPSLGPAPKWCSFLDNVTEELEEKSVSSVYDNYKFVTNNQLQQLGLSHVIGTNVAKPYMHGYFIDMRLYEEARLISDPYAYREHREREIKRKIEKQRESRIRGINTGNQNVKVNKKLAAQSKEEIDERFSALFENPEFEIDENSYEYRLLHGGKSGLNTPKPASDLRTKPRGLSAVERESEDVPESSDEDDTEKAVQSHQRRNDSKPRQSRQQSSNGLDDSYYNEKASAARENTFGERLQTANSRGRNGNERNMMAINPQEREISFAPRRSKQSQFKKSREGDSGRTRPRHEPDRRRASKNAFRGS